VIEIIRRLLDHGARVSAHDPKAAEAFRLQQPDMAEVELAAGPEALFEGADAIVLVTEWKQYLGLDWAGLRPRMRAPVLVDGRNALNRVEMEAAGYRYLRIP